LPKAAAVKANLFSREELAFVLLPSLLRASTKSIRLLVISSLHVVFFVAGKNRRCGTKALDFISEE
jgi:hypothetical protein